MSDPATLILLNDPKSKSILNSSYSGIVNKDRPRKFLTLIFVFDTENKRVLLGRKTRRFGEGKWNGFGGKFDATVDSTIQGSAARELHEECNLEVPESLLRKDAVIFYQYAETLQEKLFEVHCFSVNLKQIPEKKKDGSENTPAPSEEMDPVKWFSREEIPLDQMWLDDPFWLPEYLRRHLSDETAEKTAERKKDSLMFTAAFDFSDYSTITNHKVDQYE